MRVRLSDWEAGMTNKVVGICPCCFREIAVRRGLMVHHGYERQTGYHTSSCEAALRFKPLEVSREGLQWLLVVTENSQYRDKKRLGDKAGWPLNIRRRGSQSHDDSARRSRLGTGG